MKHLKLFFALFAMLALGVGNAWAEEVTVSFASTAQRLSRTDDQQVWENEGVTFTNDKAASSTKVADYSNPVRLYQSSTITVDCSKGKITQIVFATNASKYVTPMQNSLGSSLGTVTTNGNNVTLVLTTPAASTGAIALTGQVRLNSITVTYEKEASAEPTISCSNSVNFGVVLSGANAAKELVVEGENLTENITATLTTGTAFSVSGDLTATGGTLTLTVTATEAGAYTDVLTLTSGTITKEVELSASVFVCEGEGTEAKPYTINDVISLANPGTSAWVEGYIVGTMENNKLVTSSFTANSNLALGATADATENIVPVALPTGDIRTALNLIDNSGNLGKKVAVYGQLVSYFSTTGVKNTSNYKWVAAEGAPEAPTFTPAAGTYFAAQNVTITAEEGATIYYTIDGTDPTTASTVYSAPIAVGETTTVKAIAVKAEQLSPVASAKYTINLPLTTMDQIFAKATEVGSTATSVQVVMNNWVVTGVKNSNAYVTDGTKGLIIYKSSHGFVVGDVLSGTVACKVQLYNGSSELTELTSTTAGLTVTTGGTVTPVEVNDVTTLSGVNTGAVVKITGTCTQESSKYYVAGVQLYNSLFTYTNPTVGKKYNVTGVYLQYNTTQEILPRQQEDIEEIVDALPSATISIANITMEVGEEKTIEATITPVDAPITYETTATCITLNGTTITAVSEGTATITATIAGKDGEYTGATKTFTVTVKPVNIATLPFAFDGKQADIANTLGMSHSGVDASDYSSSPHLKFNHAGDNLIVRFDSQAGEFSFVLKQNGSNAGTFTVYESANGEDYTPVWTGGDLGNAQSATITPTLAAASRYVKFEYTTKGTSTNYGLGSISIQKPDLRQEAGLAWSAETTSITIGEAFTAPTLSNPNGLTLTCTSDNDALATVTNAGVITLKEGVTGKAVITASYAGNETYKTAEVTTTIFVNPKSDDVVILAKYNGQWYAMKAEYTTGKTDRLAALPVNYVDGKLYNVSEEDKAAITWKLSVNGGNATFQNDTNYLTGGTSTALSLSETAFDWTFDGGLYLSDSDSRTFIYHKDGYFRNYAKGNPENYPDTYSTLPTVTAPVYATAIEINGDNNSTVIGTTAGQTVNVIVDRSFEAGDEWYTLCVPFNMQASVIGKAYQISGLVQKTADYVEVYLAEKTTIVAGEPYLIKPTVTVDKFVVENATIVNTTGASISKSISGLSVTMQGVINGNGTTDGLYWVGNGGFLYNDVTSKLGLRTYFSITTSSGIAPRMRVVAGENQATGVDNIVAPEGQAIKVIENGQLIIIRGGEKFNVQGQKL